VARLEPLPVGWAWTTLSEIARPSLEKVDPSTAPDLPFVGLEHIESGGSMRLLGHGYARDVTSIKSVFRRGDVLFGKLRPYLRKIWRAEFDGVCSTDILVFRPTIAVDGSLLAQLLASPAVADHAVRESAGINLPRVSASVLGGFELALPPIAEQRRIIAKVERLIPRTRRASAALSETADLLGVYRSAIRAASFRGRLPADSRVLVDDGEVSLSQGVIPDVELSVIERYALPHGWSWRYIGKLCTVVRGASPRPAGDPRFFGGGDTPWITVGEITRDDAMYLDSTATFLTPEGRARSRYIDADTLLLTNSGATLGVPKITRIAGCINDGSVALLGLNEVDRRYLYHYLAGQTTRLREINQGAAQPNLNTSIVRSIPVPWPPAAERSLICATIDSRLGQISTVANALGKCVQQSKLLETVILIQAFSGKLVPQDPNDEPAAELLARLKPPTDTSLKLKRPKSTGAPTKPAHDRKDNPMTKSRFDPEVKGQAYLAKLLREAEHGLSVEELYRRADLSLVDFYKQLGWEVENKMIRDNPTQLRAV
jgi:type I restriction enzyme S subunit